MKRILAIIIILAICLSFSACEDRFQSVSSLMRPPKLSGEDSVLQEAFEESVSNYENIIMKTPISGKYRSSYILFDIDNDEQEEAIVLYSIPTEGNYVIAKVFKYSNGEWITVSEIKGNTDEIYEVNFADINGDGCHEIFLSWRGIPIATDDINTSYLSLIRTLMVYSYDGVKTDLIMTEPYTNLFIEDLNNNKSDEILLFNINFANADNQTTVRVLSFNEDYSVLYDNITKITDMIEINNIVSDRVAYGDKMVSRVFVDGTIGKSGIITEIIEFNEDNFSTTLPLYGDNCTSQPKTLRNVKFYCLDIEKDGNIEIPTIDIFPYSQKVSENNTEPINLIVWLGYEENGFYVKFKTLLNTKVGHVVFIPEDFIGNITAIYDEDNLNLTFYSVDSNGTFEKALFSFRIFTIPDWEENNYNYEMLDKNDTYVYSYLIFKADNYEKYKKFISENFYAL